MGRESYCGIAESVVVQPSIAQALQYQRSILPEYHTRVSQLNAISKPSVRRSYAGRMWQGTARGALVLPPVVRHRCARATVEKCQFASRAGLVRWSALPTVLPSLLHLQAAATYGSA
jgi:hypothetical protein